MTLKVAIIADDLTGALDTGTPFVDAGLSVAVAIDVGAISETLATGCEVVVVNTASRALPEEEAAGRVRAAAKALLAASPQIVLKKIDSRLKGNVAAESAALAASFGHEAIVVAPAIPDQERLTRNGHVVGRGVDRPLPIAELFDASDTEVLVRDAETDGDLDQVVEAHDWTNALAVGARGIGAALARKIGQPNRTSKSFTASSRISGPPPPIVPVRERPVCSRTATDSFSVRISPLMRLAAIAALVSAGTVTTISPFVVLHFTPASPSLARSR